MYVLSVMHNSLLVFFLDQFRSEKCVPQCGRLVAHGKESTCQCRTPELNPCITKTPWRRKWQPTPVFLPGESQGQRSLVGYSPWGHRDTDMT